MAQNAIPTDDVAERIAAATAAKRAPDYTAEVRRLLDAALAVMEKNGTTARARVADIVATAGLSNDAFYRHFKSKDALVAALLEDGTQRLVSYVAHQMSKATTPADQVRRWVQGVLAQAEEKTAATTLAVLWNASNFDAGIPSGSRNASEALGALLHEPFAALGSTTPELDASLVAHAVLGRLPVYLEARTRPSRSEIDHITQFCIQAAAN